LYIVPLRHGDVLWPQLALILEPPELEDEQLRFRDLGDHPDQLLLDELERRDGLAELDPLLRVLERPVVAGHRRAHGAPGDAVARLIEARQRPLEALHAGEAVLQWNLAILERQLGGDRRAHRELAVDVERRKARRALLDEGAS